MQNWPAGMANGDSILKEATTTVTPAANMFLQAEDVNEDCRSARQKALAEHRSNPSSGVYIPDCMGPNDSLYTPIQCHKEAGIVL